jgi:trehalose 6-phosphate phosphatase
MMPFFSEVSNSLDLSNQVKPGMLCAFDFDGTLAPIVSQPDQALLPAAVRQRLVALKQLTPVAILTGRGLTDIRSRLQFEASYVIGNHGLEGLPGSSDCLDRYEQMCKGWLSALRSALAEYTMFDENILIEDKSISLSIHYRATSNYKKTEQALRTLFDSLQPSPHVIAGKCVFNLLPHGAGDKGTAFEQLMLLTQCETALYVGDDVTDEDVFKLKRNDVLSVRIGESQQSAAKCFLSTQDDITRFLDFLIHKLS